jgi:hypothetical protein
MKHYTSIQKSALRDKNRKFWDFEAIVDGSECRDPGFNTSVFELASDIGYTWGYKWISLIELF